MIFSKKNRFRNKLILFFVLAASLIVFLGTYRNIYYMNKFANEEFVQKVTISARDKNIFFDELFINLANSARAIASDRLLASAIIKNDFLRPKAVFETIMNANKDYMQLRFLDTNGNELIRIQRDKPAQLSYFVNDLQNKSNRYYFKENTSLPNGKVWFSDIDLNIEHGQIETPIKPVLRIVSAVYIEGKFKGLVIINRFMENFLKQLTSSSLFYIYLTDSKGNFLIHKNPIYNWAKYLKKNYTIKDEFPEFYQDILNGSLSIEPSDKLFVQDFKVGQKQDLKMIFVQNEESLQKNELASKQLGIFIGFIGILLSLPMGYIFAKPFNKMHEELEELNHTLEKRVNDAIEKNRQNEQILMQQSKLAAMGEMIGNIAHQWRQPLTRLSLIIQNITIAYENDKLNKAFIKKSEKSALDQIEFMSDTIDDFREFFAPNRDKELFCIEDILKEALKLQSASIKHNNISLNLEMQHCLKVYGYKNEFAQVILNIINNAKDAFIERNIKNRKIWIKTFKEDKNINIVIIDNAGGIEKENINSIFEPYFTTKFKSMGTGIGLYMSKVIIQKHMNGSISVENVKDGAQFIIKIPINKG